MTLFTITKSDEFEGASVILKDGTVLPVAADHPRYEAVLKGLVEGLDEEAITKLVNPAQAAYGSLTRLTDRVTRKGNTLFFDGDVLNNALTKHIVRIMDEEVNAEGDITENSASWQAYVNFLEKLATNPSETSKEHLYAFIEHHDITLFDDGDILLYKGVRDDGTSHHAGYGIVDDVVYENANLPNKVGSIVEIPRSMVDEDRNSACSTGLHGGTHQYVMDYFGRGMVMTIKVNPRDVVSVPHDVASSKVRVARYEVLELNEERKKFDSTVYVVSTFVPVEDDEEDFEDEDLDMELDFGEDDGFEDAVDDFDPSDYPEGSRVPEYRDLIVKTLIPNGISLKRFRGRNVTAGRRDEFTEAMNSLGLED